MLQRTAVGTCSQRGLDTATRLWRIVVSSSRTSVQGVSSTHRRIPALGLGTSSCVFEAKRNLPPFVERAGKGYLDLAMGVFQTPCQCQRRLGPTC